MDRHYISLELDKILQRLSTFAGSFDAKETILALEPQTDLDDVQRLQQQTVDAHMLMARFGGPSFGGLKNVNNALSRANAGSVLSMRELLDVAGDFSSHRQPRTNVHVDIFHVVLIVHFYITAFKRQFQHTVDVDLILGDSLYPLLGDRY